MKTKIISLAMAAVLLTGSVAACQTQNTTTPETSVPGTSAPADTTAPANTTAPPAETTAPATEGTTAPAAEPSGDYTSGEHAQGVTDTEILVGNTAATTGAFATVGVPFNAGIEAYFKMVNEGGGIAGRQLKFTHSDDEFDPAKGKAMMQTLVEDEKIFAYVGHFGTPVIAATIPDLEEYGIPAVYFASGIGELYNAKAEGPARALFPVQPIYITEGEIMVVRAVGNFEAKKIGVIYTNDDAGKDMLRGAEQKASELGVELVSEQVAAGATDVSAAVTAVKNADVDVVIAASIQATIGTIVKAMAAQDMTVDVITSYVNVAPTVAEAVFADIDGKFDVYGNGWISLSDPEAAAELATMGEWVGEEYAYNPYTMSGWIAAHFFTEGLRRVDDGVLSWDNYINAMESAPIKIPFGGEVNFANGLRAGTTTMNLSKIASATGWEEIEPLQAVEEILGQN